MHVTDFNRLMWDNGIAPTRVIGHGVADPGPLYSGEIPRVATMINEPGRRGRIVGADLLEPLSAYAQIDVWGIGTEGLCANRGAVRGRGDVPTRGCSETSRAGGSTCTRPAGPHSGCP
ncbi:putative glycosyl transferase [Mycobacterium avium subsp. avium 2285 (R)]|nr:putative glycosyl transferase [Mycobacterium avium subsp. avium 2285 (R)]